MISCHVKLNKKIAMRSARLAQKEKVKAAAATAPGRHGTPSGRPRQKAEVRVHQTKNKIQIVFRIPLNEIQAEDEGDHHQPAPGQLIG